MIELGAKVRDTVSGFEGTAVTRHSYLHGCDRITLQPCIDKAGKLPDAESFDESQLGAIGSGASMGYTSQVKE